MIDEPLALLAEAFGQDPEIPLLPLAAGEASDDTSDLAVIAAAFFGQVESPATRH